MLMRGDL